MCIFIAFYSNCELLSSAGITVTVTEIYMEMQPTLLWVFETPQPWSVANGAALMCFTLIMHNIYLYLILFCVSFWFFFSLFAYSQDLPLGLCGRLVASPGARCLAAWRAQLQQHEQQQLPEQQPWQAECQHHILIHCRGHGCPRCSVEQRQSHAASEITLDAHPADSFIGGACALSSASAAAAIALAFAYLLLLHFTSYVCN